LEHDTCHWNQTQLSATKTKNNPLPLRQ
jgi:hypothetical protein